MTNQRDIADVTVNEPPMTVISAEVDWCASYDQPARLRITVNRMPDRDAFLWQRSQRNPHCYFAEAGGEARFYFASDNGKGYAGRTFHLDMADGSTVDLKGPWSGSSYAVNGTTEFGPVVDVSVVERFGRYPLRYATSVTLELAEFAAELAGTRLVEWKPDWKTYPGTSTWVPWGGPVRRCFVCMCRLRDGECRQHGKPCPACGGLGAFEFPPRSQDGDALDLPCPVCHPWLERFPGLRIAGNDGPYLIEPADPGQPAVWTGR